MVAMASTALLALSLVPLMAVGAAAGTLWDAGGLEVVAGNYEEDHPVICPDGTGGAFIVWEDYRYNAISGVDLYAQHLGPTGQRLWEDDLEVCRATGDQTEPCIVPDGGGGFYVAWVDERVDSAGDIYATHIDSDGAVHAGWSNYGNVVSEEDPDNHTHDDPCICAVPTGGGGHRLPLVPGGYRQRHLRSEDERRRYRHLGDQRGGGIRRQSQPDKPGHRLVRGWLAARSHCGLV